jgi:hypothetical protein
MNDEELIHKAFQMGISINDLNKYTKPKAILKERNIFNDGKFEEWDDLEKKYYGNDKNTPFMSNREWKLTGCSIDLNDEDGTKSSIICKDKYPALCFNHMDKCESSDKSVQKYMHENCPETCKVQYKNIKDLGGSGILSICTRQGRCKSPLDNDPSNLLPVCDDINVYKQGSDKICSNYLTKTKLEGELRDKKCNSTDCKRQKCLNSGSGCVFESGSKKGCLFNDKIDRNIRTKKECYTKGNRKATWIGSIDNGQCMLESYVDEENTMVLKEDQNVI